jgi:hypothetical protein
MLVFPVLTKISAQELSTMNDASAQLDSGYILQTAFGFWSSKVLLTAVDFGVFTKPR